jgi:hypothetical protein
MHILVVEALLILYSTLGSELILIDIRNPVGQVPVSYEIAGPCQAEPLQLVPTLLGLSPAGPYQLRCTSLGIATETRPVPNTKRKLGPIPVNSIIIQTNTCSSHESFSRTSRVRSEMVSVPHKRTQADSSPKQLQAVRT